MTKRKPGRPLPRISNDYVEPAPTQQEIDVLISLWNTYAPSAYHGLIETETKSVLEQTGQQPRGRFVWDDQRGRYIEVKSGRILSRDEVRLAYAQFLKAYSRR